MLCTAVIMVHLLCFPKYYRGSSETETYFQGGKLKSAVLKDSFEMHFKNGNMAIHSERGLLTRYYEMVKTQTSTWDFTLQNSASLSPSEQ